jgi:predicted dehydrogenase
VTDALLATGSVETPPVPSPPASTANATDAADAPSRPTVARPRLGFLGVGWIGRNRMQAIVDADVADVAAIADPSPEMAGEALKLAPRAGRAESLDDLLSAGVDGVVIATPSALHAEQSIRALEAGAAVFCQKPLGRTEAEVRRVVNAARAADRLLAVDLSYRFTTAMRAIRDRVRSGELGRVYAADLVFHNAYGPDKPWFRDPVLSGGGCVMDLGVHLVDLALWVLDFPDVACVHGRLFAKGERLVDSVRQVEDHATAEIDLADGVAVRIACSWNLSAGTDAVISAAFHGTGGGAAMHNVGGSFHDFRADLFHGTKSEPLASPPDAWGGRAAVDWARRLAAGERFDPRAERLATVARVLDRIYGR